MTCPIFQHHSLKRLCFLPWTASAPLSKINCPLISIFSKNWKLILKQIHVEACLSSTQITKGRNSPKVHQQMNGQILEYPYKEWNTKTSYSMYETWKYYAKWKKQTGHILYDSISIKYSYVKIFFIIYTHTHTHTHIYISWPSRGILGKQSWLSIPTGLKVTINSLINTN